jgi:hypothetical protein
MRKSNLLLFALFAISVLICGSTLVSTGEEWSYGMSGKITALEPDNNTVVVEVIQGDDQFTVAGPLSSDAILLKGDESANLGEFNEGDSVMVHFYSTDEGHVIYRMCDARSSPC